MMDGGAQPTYGYGSVPEWSCNSAGGAPYLAKDVDDLLRENSDMSPPATEMNWRPTLLKTLVSGVGFFSDAYDLYLPLPLLHLSICSLLRWCWAVLT